MLESGRAALARARAGGDVLAWLTVAEAVTLLRSKIMQAVGSDSPNGYRYKDAFGRWSRHLDLDMDKATRSRLLGAGPELAGSGGMALRPAAGEASPPVSTGSHPPRLETDVRGRSIGGVTPSTHDLPQPD